MEWTENRMDRKWSGQKMDWIENTMDRKWNAVPVIKFFASDTVITDQLVGNEKRVSRLIRRAQLGWLQTWTENQCGVKSKNTLDALVRVLLPTIFTHCPCVISVQYCVFLCYAAFCLVLCFGSFPNSFLFDTPALLQILAASVLLISPAGCSVLKCMYVRTYMYICLYIVLQ